MRALRFHQFGDLNALKVETLPDPNTQPGEIMVQIKAASVNPSDVKNVLGKMEGTTLPRVPGRDFSGIVIEGPEPLRGKEVWGAGGDIGFTRDGSHAEAIAVPAAGVRIKPSNLSFAEAAAVGVNFVTAYVGLIQTTRVNAAETVLVTGARGGVGSAVVQLAAWKGARVFGLDREPYPAPLRGASQEFSGATDADYVRIVEEVQEATQGKGVDVVFDTVGGPLFEPCLRMLAKGGRQVNISSTGARRVTFDLLDFYRKSLSLYGVDTRALDTVACAAILQELSGAFENGTLAGPNVQYRLALDSLSQAYVGIDENTLRGKAVLTL